MISDSLIKSLDRRDLILPYFENAITSAEWPSSYAIKVDSGPYYGLDQDGKPDGYFHPSTHPLLPARLLYHMFHPETRDLMVKERTSLQREMVLSMGSALHAVFQTQMVMAGMCAEEDVEVEFLNRGVRGRIDLMVPDHPAGHPVLVELKTRTPYLYSVQEGPEPSWVAQVNLGLDAMDCDTGVIVMMESGSPYRMREFLVNRDRQLLDLIYDKFDLVRECIELNSPPPMDCPDAAKCPARLVCGCQP